MAYILMRLILFYKEDFFMLKKKTKNLLSKGMGWAAKILPVIVPALLIFNANSTGCIFNGQPDPPKNLRKYRKF